MVPASLPLAGLSHEPAVLVDEDTGALRLGNDDHPVAVANVDASKIRL